MSKPVPMTDRAVLHRVIGALEKQLDAIGCTHKHHELRPGHRHSLRCHRCRAPGFTWCFDCQHWFCGFHIAIRGFADAKEERRYYRLLSKIVRLNRELVQGQLFPGR
jgi:hypothetical protein